MNSGRRDGGERVRPQNVEANTGTDKTAPGQANKDRIS